MTISHINGVRAVAALMVLVFHLYTYDFAGQHTFHIVGIEIEASGLMSQLFQGVTLFFVLSGFLLALPWLRASANGNPFPSLGTYARRRAWRILPLYWVWIIPVTALTIWRMDRELLQTWDGVKGLLAHVFLLRGIYPDDVTNLSLYIVSWTLTSEIFFYLVLPFMVRSFTGRRWIFTAPLITAFSIAWIIATYLGYNPLITEIMQRGQSDFEAREWIAGNIPSTISYFIIGVAGAAVWVRLERSRRDHPGGKLPRYVGRVLAATGALTIAVCVVGFAKIHTDVLGRANAPVDSLGEIPAQDWTWQAWAFMLRSYGYALGFTAIIVGLGFCQSALSAPLRSRPLSWIGEISYSVYLWHYPLIILTTWQWSRAGEATGWHRSLYLALVVIPVTFLLSWMSYALIEKTGIARGRQKSSRVTTRHHAAERKVHNESHASSLSHTS